MEMQKYIDQIVDDLNKLMDVPPPFEKYEEPYDFNRMMMDFETAFLHQEGIPADEFTKITREELPPAERMSREQIHLLTKAMMDFLMHCQYFPEFPDNLPEEIMYKTLRENWEKFILPEVPVCCHQEFCEYEKENCPFPGYCTSCDEKEPDSILMEIKDDLLPGESMKFFRKRKIDETYIRNRKNHFKELIKTMDEGKNIAGIYNYCDRWCERCMFTEKCSVSQLQEGLEYQSSSQGIFSWNFENILAFFDVISEIHEGTVEKKDIENNPAEKLEALIDEILPDYTKELIDIADHYAWETQEWLDLSDYLFEDNDGSVNDLYEIISMHHFVILEKLERANNGLCYLDEEDCCIQNDVYGSAKVALISVRKSLKAWKSVAEAFPCQADIAIDRCKELKKLEKGILMRFPYAEKFVRPGFDENNSQ